MAASEVDFVLVDRREMLRDHFALLDEGVQAVGVRTPTDAVCAGDVYAAALRGECEVRLIRVGEVVSGFMATAASTGLDGSRSLYVWMLYLEPGVPDSMPDVVSELDFVAMEQGCTRVEFATTRPAWERKLKGLGYSPSLLVFRKELR